MASLLGAWTPAVAWMTLIFWSSAQPRPLSSVPDWLAHGAAYLVLAALVCRAASHASGELRTSRLLLAVAFCALYGAADEYHQSFVPGRSAQAADVWSDVAGAAVGALLFRWAPSLMAELARRETRQSLRG